MTNVHHFENSRDAYDASQYRDGIKDGDVLVVNGPDEKSVAVLVGAWPIAISGCNESTSFHVLRHGATFAATIAHYCQRFRDVNGFITDPELYAKSEEVAKAELEKLRS